ncbi:MAG: Xaa-Pro peptidase family protein [Rhodospirillaceae bacterium]|nr:Xaa-Pro peptidase family protein [Rhodospirillaceae bacterium]
MLLNRPRADAVMRAHGLDGLAALVPHNVQYLTDYRNLLMAAGFDASVAAVLPAAHDAPAALVTAAFDTRNVVNARPWVPNVVIYTDHPQAPQHATPGGGAPYAGWGTRPDADLTTRQATWVQETARLTEATAQSCVHGLVKAIRDAGLANGRIGVDDERLLMWLPELGLTEATIVPARHLFNEIRMVKTPDEIALLRVAARLNEAALLKAAAALREGATWEQLERVYMAEMAAHGARGIYLECGAGGLQSGKVVRHEPVMFDALGQYQGYHGDFGRSAVVGEPGPDVAIRVKALEAGWRAAHDTIRPGVRYSELAAKVAAAVKGAGFPGPFRTPVVHALGLQHTDDPAGRWDPPGKKADRVLEADMVLNVDLPHIEIGWGAVHIEDTVRVTADGCEPLTSMDTALRVVAA